jgi:ABC-2 type transport system ATP-binding protein
VASGTVEELTTGGRRRLVVKVEGDWAGAWARDLPGTTISRVESGAVRLVLDEHTDPQAVLSAAMAAGPVEQFGFERQRLSEVFREALA